MRHRMQPMELLCIVKKCSELFRSHCKIIRCSFALRHMGGTVPLGSKCLSATFDNLSTPRLQSCSHRSPERSMSSQPPDNSQRQTRFINYPDAIEGPKTAYKTVQGNNPVLSGLPLSIVASMYGFITKKTPNTNESKYRFLRLSS